MNSVLLQRSPGVCEKRALLPRLGFLGVGGIGRHRLEAIAQSGAAEIVAIADSSAKLAEKAAQSASEAVVLHSLDDLLEMELDGVVIATPSALHAEQAIAALERGVAVFCQKPLGRSAWETRRVIRAAYQANRLLAVDLPYRFMSGIRKIHELCGQGDLGEIYTVDLMFHHAHGPDNAWFYDPKLSGGGCIMDLGIHLIDLALWNLNYPEVEGVTSRLFSQGKLMHGRAKAVEDYAMAQLNLETGATIRLACSWKLPAGCEAIISGSFFGTKGGAAFHNIDGSLYDFRAERYRGTQREALTCLQEDWAARAALDWVRRLARDGKFNPQVESLNPVAAVLDAIYESSGADPLAIDEAA
jgi:predicted dehydrogenase